MGGVIGGVVGNWLALELSWVCLWVAKTPTRIIRELARVMTVPKLRRLFLLNIYLLE